MVQSQEDCMIQIQGEKTSTIKKQEDCIVEIEKWLSDKEQESIGKKQTKRGRPRSLPPSVDVLRKRREVNDKL